MKKNITLFLALISFNVFSQIPTIGLVGYWPFTNNASDVSGNGNNGIVTSATLTTDRFNNPNSAYLFNGTSDFITVSDVAVLRLSNTDFTISAWINESSLASIQEAVISKRTGAGQNGYIFNMEGSTQTIPGRANFQVSGGNDPKAYSDSIIPLNSWHNIVFEFVLSNQTIYTYIDCILNSITTGIPSPNATASDMVIGNDSVVNAYFFHGKIDDIAIYNRTLVLSEIQQLYFDCQGVDITSNLIAKLDFTGNANDVSGNGNNGIATGAILTTDRFGNLNSAYLFNGISDFITVPDAVALRLNNTDFTISAWINESSLSSIQEAVISKRTGAGQNGYIFNMEGSTQTIPGRANFQVSGGNDPKAYSDSIVPLNSWHNIVFVYILSNHAIYTYIDGILNSITSGIPTPNPAASDMVIGNDSVVNTYFFHGKIDDIAIYNRALTSCDIDSLFHMPNQGPTEIKFNSITSGFLLFPNPSNGTFSIIGKFSSSTQIHIYDLFGQEVVQPIELQGENISVQLGLNVMEGIYLCRVISGVEILGEAKLIIVK